MPPASPARASSIAEHAVAEPAVLPDTQPRNWPEPTPQATEARSSSKRPSPKPTLPRSQAAIPAAAQATPITSTQLPTTTTQLPATTTQLVERPLFDLSPDAVAFLDSRAGRGGVAVAVPERGTVYTYNGNELFPLASVAKVMIIVAVMNRAIGDQRPLTDQELEQLRLMITVSDNDAAQSLWDSLGGGAAVAETLRGIGLTETQPAPSAAWGDTLSSPREVALLLVKMATGAILDQSNRDLALGLMSSVDPDQSWGATAGAPAGHATETIVAVKNGWYPAPDGWWVNSAAVIVPSDRHPRHSIVVLTDQQPTYQYGIETIQGVASRIHAALYGFTAR